MKTKLLIYLCILALVTFLVGHTYACPCDQPYPLFTVYPSIYDAPTDTYYVCVGGVITFDARNSFDPDCHWCTGADYCGDGIELLQGIRQFQWDFSFVMGEGFHSECSETPGDGIATYTYGNPGPYTVKLFVTDNDQPCCCDDYPNCWDWSMPREKSVVAVKVENVTFDPTALCADGSSTSTASATITPDTRTITWSIQGDALGCSINSSTGVITAGTTTGTITVRAADSVLSSCYAEADLDLICDCGPSGSCTALSDAEWTYVVNQLPNLFRCNVCKEAPADPDYNCIAWTIDVTDDKIWYQLDEPGPPYYGNDNGHVEVSEFDTFYAYHGVPAILYGTGPGPIYVPKHAAIPLPDNCASSKLGPNIRMRHDRNELEGGYYDDIIKTY